MTRILVRVIIQGTDEVHTNQGSQLFEYWERKDDNKLRLVYCTQDVILADSDNKDDDVAIIPS